MLIIIRNISSTVLQEFMSEIEKLNCKKRENYKNHLQKKIESQEKSKKNLIGQLDQIIRAKINKIYKRKPKNLSDLFVQLGPRKGISETDFLNLHQRLHQSKSINQRQYEGQ